MNGKNKCKMLKEIRRKIATKHGIPYVSYPCTYEGDNCLGTCPSCDSESELIFNYIKENHIQLSDEDIVEIAGSKENFDSKIEAVGFEFVFDPMTGDFIKIKKFAPDNRGMVGAVPLQTQIQIDAHGYNPFDIPNSDYRPSFDLKNPKEESADFCDKID